MTMSKNKLMRCEADENPRAVEVAAILPFCTNACGTTALVNSPEFRFCSVSQQLLVI
jgi:hypothetical protein